MNEAENAGRTGAATGVGVLQTGTRAWFNSHGEVTTLEEIFELEVEERENYTAEEFQRWLDKYGLTLDMAAIWGAPREKAQTYCDNAEDEPVELTAASYGAFIVIEESDDGDEGFLLVLMREKSMQGLFYNDQMDAGEQTDGEESIAATIFERQDGNALSRTACDRLGLDIFTGILAKFPIEWTVKDEDFKRLVAQISTRVFEAQGSAEGGRMFGEEECNQLGRDILIQVIAFLHPELIIEPDADRPAFSAARLTRTLESFAEHHGGEEPGELVPDLMADAMHYCDRHGINFDEMLEIARANYEEEIRESAAAA